MESSVSKKQFDLSHINIDEKLQGARLASFPRRALAYGADWLIIIACTEFLWLIIPLALLYLLVKRRLRNTIRSSSRFIKKQVIYADRKLDQYAIDQQLRKRFVRHLTVYLHLVIYLPVFFAVVLFAGMVWHFFLPESYESITTTSAGMLQQVFQPVFELTDATGLIFGYLGAFIYFSIFTWQWKGQTPGKKMMRIQVVKLNGNPISFWGSLERSTGYTASATLLFLGFFQYFWDRNRQTTHDKITETIVIEAS